MAVADDAQGDVKPARERPWWRSPYLLYVIFVHTPLSITAICVAAVFKQGLVPWAGVVLGVGAILPMVPAGWARAGATRTGRKRGLGPRYPVPGSAIDAMEPSPTDARDPGVADVCCAPSRQARHTRTSLRNRERCVRRPLVGARSAQKRTFAPGR
jgi:hypothetical protein